MSERDLLRRDQPALPRSRTLAVAATFTADPLLDPLRFWLREAELAVAPVLAPIGQVPQQLLDPSSFFAQYASDLHVALVRIRDVEGKEGNALDQIETLAQAIESRVGQTPLLVIRCPDDPSREANVLVAEAEQRLLSACRPERGVYGLGAEHVLELFPAGDYSSAHGDTLGGIPYTDAFFSALASLIVRHIHALDRPPVKAIAIDADGTLWDGVCAEVGVDGVGLSPSRLAVQQFLQAQAEAGVALCLCSKNRPEDVWAVFDGRPDMVLRREHFAAYRINWNAKSANILSLADELNLAADAFVFLDDNPVERAEVRAHAPSVLTLELPEDPENWPRALRDTWAFDRLAVTETDRRRGGFYRDERERREAHEAASTFQEFLERLAVDVQVEPATSEEAERIAQLTQRTNQFNTVGVRLSLSEVVEWIEKPRRRLYTVRAKDRFGDYGLVGAAFCTSSPPMLRVEALTLSCRALGRGVEHRLLNALSRHAAAKHDQLSLRFVATDRNLPARAFLESVATCTEDEGGSARYTLSVEDAQTVELRAEAVPASATTPRTNGSEAGATEGRDSTESKSINCAAESFRLARLATWWRDPEASVAAARGMSPRPSEMGPAVPPAGDTEQGVAVIWSEILGIREVGREDSFFALGGDSLKATRMLARVDAELGVALPLRAAFDYPVLSALAEHLLHTRLAAVSPDEIASWMREIASEADQPTVKRS